MNMFMELLNSVFGFISLKKKTYPKMVVSPPENMNLLTESTGLHHLIETIFMNLSYEDLLIKCQQVNVQWRCLVRNPLLWLQKCESLTKEKCVTKLTRNIIEVFYHLHLEDELTPVLMEIYMNSRDLQEPIPQKSIYYSICVSVYKKFIEAVKQGAVKTVKKLAPLLEEPNFIDVYGDTPIIYVTMKGNLDMIKVLISLTDDPLKIGKYDQSPIHIAAENGDVEIVKLLAPLTETPNAPNRYGKTPIHLATENGHTDIVRILAPLTMSSNDPDSTGHTPIYVATKLGHTEIVKILAPLSHNPNAPNSKGVTPMILAAQYGNFKIVQILEDMSPPQRKKYYEKFGPQFELQFGTEFVPQFGSQIRPQIKLKLKLK